MSTLLIVDSNALHLRLYKKEFEKQGFFVLAAQNEAEALTLLKIIRPSLVILDPMILSDRDGLEILSSILERKPELPIVLNTIYHDLCNPSLIRRASAYIEKSSNLEELKCKVRTLLGMEDRGPAAERRQNLYALSLDSLTV